MILLLLVLASYSAGSIPFGKLVGIRLGVDIQKHGSGNIGFANVRRILGWRAGLLTLAGDIIKGYFPTIVAMYLYGEAIAFWVGLAAIVGHIFPVWLKFRGGKGIATGLGTVAALEPLAALFGAIIYIAAGIAFKKSSVASLIGLGAAVVIGIYLNQAFWWHYLVFICIACWTLRHNIAGKVPNYAT